MYNNLMKVEPTGAGLAPTIVARTSGVRVGSLAQATGAPDKPEGVLWGRSTLV